MGVRGKVRFQVERAERVGSVVVQTLPFASHRFSLLFHKQSASAIVLRGGMQSTLE